jgi:hypothetical protein
MGEAGIHQGVGAFGAVLAHGPDADAVIHPGRRDPESIGAEGHRVQFFERLAQRVQPGAGSHIPELQSAISADASQNFAVRAER